MRPLVRLSIGQPSPLRTFDRHYRPHRVVNPEFDAIAVAKIKFRKVTGQVSRGDVLIDAVDPTLED